MDNCISNLPGYGIKTLWMNLLQAIDKKNDEDIHYYILDRGESTTFESIQPISFPKLNINFPHNDRKLIDKIATQLGIDTFISSYYTFTLVAKNILIVYDLIPERFNFVQGHLFWMYRKLAILNATNYLAISKFTKEELLSFYPFIDEKMVSFAYPGIEHFSKRSNEITKKNNNVYSGRPFILMIGSRYGEMGYKNMPFVLDSLYHIEPKSLKIIFLGGEEITLEEKLISSKREIEMERVEYNPEVYADLLKNCFAVLYPSRIEGFGFPVHEATEFGKQVIVSDSLTGIGLPKSSNIVKFDRSSPHDLANKIQRILSARTGQNLSVSESRNFSTDNVRRELENMIKMDVYKDNQLARAPELKVMSLLEHD